MLKFDRKQQNSVKQLSFNKKIIIIIRKKKVHVMHMFSSAQAKRKKRKEMILKGCKWENVECQKYVVVSSNGIRDLRPHFL